LLQSDFSGWLVTEAKISAAMPPISSSDERWVHFSNLECRLTVELPLPKFRVSDLLSLAKDGVVNTHWLVGNDVPLRVNGELLAWCEFEVVESHLAVRLTELA
jgi:flagellar motor switch/type III secretory pathway protein FliN